MVVSFCFGFVQCRAKLCHVEQTRVGDKWQHFIHVDRANPLSEFCLIYSFQIA